MKVHWLTLLVVVVVSYYIGTHYPLGIKYLG
jgi:hypothetical protein